MRRDGPRSGPGSVLRHKLLGATVWPIATQGRPYTGRESGEIMKYFIAC